jgi:Zn-finger nucleic acid-binding protein
MDKCADCGGVWLDQGELEMLTHTEESNLRRVVRDMLSVRFR